jgi:hypothetical protein
MKGGEVMKVAIICEFSGVVRNAFTDRGYEAISFDLLPTERLGQHCQCDIMDIPIDYWQEFDLAICHPPCTHLAVSGARWFKEKREEQAQALDFVRYLMNLPVERIALENPVSVISSRIRKPDQIIQPYEFGHPETKRTCLWLKNLPELRPTNIVEPQYIIGKDGKRYSPVHYCSQWDKKEERWKTRSRTYPGIAEAMAEQWGKLR